MENNGNFFFKEFKKKPVKREPDPKDVRFNLRLSRKEHNLAMERAKTYARGNVSNWVRFCLDNFDISKNKPR